VTDDGRWPGGPCAASLRERGGNSSPDNLRLGLRMLGAPDRCPNCDTALTALLLPTRIPDLDHNDYLALLGALGLLLQLTLTSTDNND